MYYETTFIVNPDVSQDNTQKLADQLVERVEKSGGRVIKREYWGARTLAYSINKRKRGHYLFFVTDGGAEAINSLENAIRLDERIVRFLSVRSETFDDQASPLIRRRNKPVEEQKTTESTEDAAAKPAEDATAKSTEDTAAKPAEDAAAKPAEDAAATEASA